jgi:hypothetical protein
LIIIYAYCSLECHLNISTMILLTNILHIDVNTLVWLLLTRML